MPQGYKIRLSDGSEVGPMDLTAVRQWFAQGLIDADSHVLPPGATRWLHVSEVIPVKAAAPAARAAAPASRPPRAGEASRAGRWVWPALILLLAAAGGGAYWKLAAAPAASAPTSAPPGPAPDAARAASLQHAVETATRALPHLSPGAAQIIMGQSAAEILEPDETFRRACRLVSDGLVTLTRDEKAEMGRLTTTAYGALSAKDRTRLAGYLERVRDRHPTSPAEDHEMSLVTRRAMLSLPTARLARLQALYEKAIRSAVSAGDQA